MLALEKYSLHLARRGMEVSMLLRARLSGYFSEANMVHEHTRLFPVYQLGDSYGLGCPCSNSFLIRFKSSVSVKMSIAVIANDFDAIINAS